MSEFTPAFSRPIQLYAVCIGGPHRGEVVPVEGTCARVFGDYSGRYQWVYSRPTPGLRWVGSVWFAVWFPGG